MASFVIALRYRNPKSPKQEYDARVLILRDLAAKYVFLPPSRTSFFYYVTIHRRSEPRQRRKMFQNLALSTERQDDIHTRATADRGRSEVSPSTTPTRRLSPHSSYIECVCVHAHVRAYDCACLHMRKGVRVAEARRPSGARGAQNLPRRARREAHFEFPRREKM